MLLLRCVWQRNVRPILTAFWELLRDGLQFLNIAAPLPHSRGCGSSVLTQAACLLSRPQDPASSADRCGTIVVGPLIPAFRLERSAHGRYTWYLCPLASQGI